MEIGKNSICMTRRRPLRPSAPYCPLPFSTGQLPFKTSTLPIKTGIFTPRGAQSMRNSPRARPFDLGMPLVGGLYVSTLRLYLMTLCFAGLGIGWSLTVIGLLQFTVWFCHECTLTRVKKTKVKKLSPRCVTIGWR